ncbi:MAG TPA: hypothetical protein PLF61_07085, partial [Candidatus Goldiibacteriota bacterium]|nr:hypothetical protein [Candidatus Goldiibacteriota bacterium]
MKRKFTFIVLFFLFLIPVIQNCNKKRTPTEPLNPIAGPTIVLSVTPDVYEPDNTTLTAKAIIINDVAQYHNSHNPCDYDYLMFQASAGMQYVIETFNLESNSDTYLYLLQRDGITIIATDDDNGMEVKASRIIWVCDESGWYFIRIQQYGCMTVYGKNTGFQIRITDGPPYTPTISPTATLTHTASPICSPTTTFTITPTGSDTPFYTPTATFTITPLPVLGQGLWHEIYDNDAHVPASYPNNGISPKIWWYGQDATGNYDTGSANAGEIFFGPFFAGDGYKLYFWSYEHTENVEGYDIRMIYASAEGSDTWV